MSREPASVPFDGNELTPAPADRLAAIVWKAGFADAQFVTRVPPDAPPLLWARQAPLGLGWEVASLRRGDGLIGGAESASRGERDAGRGAAAARGAGCAAILLRGDHPGAALSDACARSGLCLVSLRTDLSTPRIALAFARVLVGASANACPGLEGAGLPSEDPTVDRLVRVAAIRPAPGNAAFPDGLEAALSPATRLRALRGAPDGVAFYSLVSSPARDKECRDSLRAYAAETGISIGLSDACGGSANAADLLRLSEHASRSLELGGSLFGEGRLSCYDNAALYLAYVDDGRDEPLLAFSKRTLERIKAHDEASGDGLYRTIEAYFRNDRNARRAARELGIHRHTLAKRLARIEEVTDYPMEAEGRLGYELALAMRHWTKGRVSR